MLQTVSISSKRQITIPVRIFNLLNLSKGDRLIVEIEQDKLVLRKSKQLLNELSGSVKIPTRYKNKPIDFIIKEAKKDYFTSRK